MAKNVNYHGRTTPLPEAKTLKYRHIAVPEWAVEDCWLHGGRYKKAECPGCVLNFEADRDFAGLLEAIGDEF
jgi:hypothetical protein